MALRNYSSTAADTTLSAGVDASTTTLLVSSTTGFPATPFILAVDAGAAAQELVLVTNVAGTTLTVTRAYDSTIASAHATGAAVSHSHAAIDFREANAHVNATAAHGTTGTVVGTSDSQTLTNKTVALGNNTLSGTTAQFNTSLTDGDFATRAGTETLTNKDLSSATNILPANLPKGVLGYAQVVASQGGITTEAGVTGLSVDVTVGAGRRIRITYAGSLASSVVNDTGGVAIKEGSTQLQLSSIPLPSGNALAVASSVVLTPSAGAHTYKIAAQRVSGTGAIQHTASATTPAYILVEDIGV